MVLLILLLLNLLYLWEVRMIPFQLALLNPATLR